MDYSNLNYYKIKEGKYKNLKILLINIKSVLNICVGFMINAGSRNEEKSYGIAHFLEHMTFKGTKKRSSIDLLHELDYLGTKYNAYTSYENTAYFISGEPSSIKKLIDIALDLYMNPKYPHEEIYKEKQVVHDELLMNLDNNGKYLSNEIYKNIYSNIDDNLARPIIGFKETIQNFNREDIIDFKNKFYTNKNSLLIISGNFNKKKIKNILSDYLNSKMKKLFYKDNNDIFGKLTINEIKIKPLSFFNKTMKKYIHIEKDITQSIVIFVFNAYNHYNENLFYLEFIADLLSTGMSSRLFKLLRGKLGITYNNASYVSSFKDYGLFTIRIAVDNKNVILAIKNILDELKNIKENINEEELIRIKNQNRVDILFQFNNAEDYFMNYGNAFLNKLKILTIEDYLKRINEVKLDYLKIVLNELFAKHNLVIGTIGQNNEYPSNEIENFIDNF